MAKSTNNGDGGAVPLAELEAMDSEVRHLRQRTAEDRVDVRARFDRLDAAVAELRTDITSGKTLARMAVFLVPIMMAVGLAIAPWMAERAVEQVLLRHGLIRSVVAADRTERP